MSDAAIMELKTALTDPEEYSGSDGVLDRIEWRLNEAVNKSNNNVACIAYSLERIASALERLSPPPAAEGE